MEHQRGAQPTVEPGPGGDPIASASQKLPVDASKLGVWLFDVGTGDISWSHRQREMAGVGLDDELCLGELVMITHADDRERLQLRIDQHYADKHPYEIKYRMVHEITGETRWVEAIGHSIWGRFGDSIRMVGCGYDVTDRKRAEEHLADIDHQAEDRTSYHFRQALSHETGISLTSAYEMAQALMMLDNLPDDAKLLLQSFIDVRE